VQLRDPPAAAAGVLAAFDNAALLQQAIPDLTHLTALHLKEAAAHDTALEHLSKLTSLQELELTLVSQSVTQASFRDLPCSLTRLKFAVEHSIEMDNDDPEFHFR
jgi:hypothetical protein